MDVLYTQNLRYKLQKRVRRLNSARWQVYHSNLQYLWHFLMGHPVLQGVIDQLFAREPAIEETAREIVDQHRGMFGNSEIQAAALSARVLKKCAASDDALIESRVGSIYARETKHSDNQQCFTEIFVEPLYEYMDEQLDDRGAMLALLRNYKHKAEWFQRDLLYGKWASDTTRGEKLLALHLYEYLHDQGMQFYIEPASVSGEADLVSAQEGSEPLIADAKVFDPGHGKAIKYLVSGFRQIYTYCLDYNQSAGYLIIFRTSEHDLRLALQDEAQGTAFVVLNGKVIFFVVIDIFPYESSASKRGKIKAYELTEGELMNIISEEVGVLAPNLGPQADA
jgi:hypothetical protein